MSKSIQIFAALGLVLAVSACGSKVPEEEYVVVSPVSHSEPISYEPAYTGKYK